MKRTLATMLYGAVAAALIGFSTTAAADFSGAYAVANWTTTNTPGQATGSVDISGAPSSVVVIGSDGPQLNGGTTFTIAAAGAGNVFFDWLYMTADVDPSTDPAGYILNGIRTQLSVDTGANTQSGNQFFAVAAGDIFGFFVDTTDNQFGSASLAISNFRAPAGTPPPPGVPEPGTVALLALGMLGFAASRKRQ